MKNDDLLYEVMETINQEEADMLEGTLQDDKWFHKNRRMEKKLLKMQEQRTMDKIHAQMKKGESPYRVHFGKRRLVFLIAAAVMMLGMFGFAKEKDWDIQMAEMLGLSSVMPELEGGYVQVGVSDTCEGITVTASQAIGDQNSQWIQFDTNVPWSVSDTGCYLMDDFSFSYYDKMDNFIPGGQEFYSYNNNGYVSFICYNTNFEKINRARVETNFRGLRKYENEQDEEGTLIQEGKWELAWKNCYVANTVVEHPFKVVELEGENGTFSCMIHKIEISPVSIRIEAVRYPIWAQKEVDSLYIDSVTLKNGTEIPVEGIGSGGIENNFALDSFFSFEELGNVNMKDIQYITIGGEQIEVNP